MILLSATKSGACPDQGWPDEWMRFTDDRAYVRAILQHRLRPPHAIPSFRTCSTRRSMPASARAALRAR